MKVSIYESGEGERVSFWTETGYGTFDSNCKFDECIAAMKETIAFLEKAKTATDKPQPVANAAKVVAISELQGPTFGDYVANTIQQVAGALQTLRAVGTVDDEDVYIAVRPSDDCSFCVKVPGKNRQSSPNENKVIHMAAMPPRRR